MNEDEEFLSRAEKRRHDAIKESLKDEKRFDLVHDHTDADGEPLEYIAERTGIGHEMPEEEEFDSDDWKSFSCFCAKIGAS